MIRLLDDETEFPPVNQALSEPDGLLAVGANLSPQRLVNAYHAGIFPWYGRDDPILWWSPNPRAVFTPASMRCSRSMQRMRRKTDLKVTLNYAFTAVMQSCRQSHQADGVWIHDEFIAAYSELHQLGHAHSVEVWEADQLVGGLYGIAVNNVFTAESMFHQRTNASKLALITFMEAFFGAGGTLVDAQLESPHLLSLGAVNIEREQFVQQLKVPEQETLRDFYQQRPLKIGF